MVLFGVAVVVVLLVSAGSTEQCGDEEFRCVNGDCIKAGLKCDGQQDCADASDEGLPTCAPNTTLGVKGAQLANTYLTARVDFNQQSHYGIAFQLCDKPPCSSIRVHGSNPQGQLAGTTNTGCNLEGLSCLSEVTVSPDGWSPFPSGELAFRVESRIDEFGKYLKVSLEDRPDLAIVVELETAQLTLSVRPLLLKKEMQVHFSGSTHYCSYPDEQDICDDGECIDSGYCTGISKCRDGSDNSPSRCNVPNVTLAVGSSVTAKVDFSAANHDMIDFLLCDETRCASVFVAGPKSEPKQQELFGAVSDCNVYGDDCGDLRFPGYPDETEGFNNGEHVFNIEHRASDFAVSLPGQRDHALTVPSEASKRTLLIRPYIWRKAMPVQFSDVGRIPEIPAQ